jgi:hypothetical protein
VASTAFHDFFLASAGVAGALIGLLFVAISVTPEAVRGKSGHLYQQVRAAAALSMFLDALVVSLLALMPGLQSLANGSTALAIAGITSTVALVIIFLRAPDPARTAWPTARTLLLFAAVLVVYAFQLASALHMNTAATDAGQVHNQASLVIIMFIMGITRAWEIVGAITPRALEVLTRESGHASPAGEAEKP